MEEAEQALRSFGPGGEHAAEGLGTLASLVRAVELAESDAARLDVRNRLAAALAEFYERWHRPVEDPFALAGARLQDAESIHRELALGLQSLLGGELGLATAAANVLAILARGAPFAFMSVQFEAVEEVLRIVKCSCELDLVRACCSFFVNLANHCAEQVPADAIKKGGLELFLGVLRRFSADEGLCCAACIALEHLYRTAWAGKLDRTVNMDAVSSLFSAVDSFKDNDVLVYQACLACTALGKHTKGFQAIEARIDVPICLVHAAMSPSRPMVLCGAMTLLTRLTQSSPAARERVQSDIGIPLLAQVLKDSGQVEEVAGSGLKLLESLLVAGPQSVAQELVSVGGPFLCLFLLDEHSDSLCVVELCCRLLRFLVALESVAEDAVWRTRRRLAELLDGSPGTSEDAVVEILGILRVFVTSGRAHDLIEEGFAARIYAVMSAFWSSKVLQGVVATLAVLMVDEESKTVLAQQNCAKLLVDCLCESFRISPLEGQNLRDEVCRAVETFVLDSTERRKLIEDMGVSPETPQIAPAWMADDLFQVFSERDGERWDEEGGEFLLEDDSEECEEGWTSATWN